MKIRRLHKTFAAGMAFLILTVSIGFSVDFHYCQGEFKNFALFKKAKSCHELAAMKASCHMKSDEKTTCHSAKVKCSSEKEGKGCCNNDTKLIQLDAEYAFGTVDFDSSIDTTFDFVIAVKALDLNSKNYKKVEYLNYKPPLITQKRTILFQSFLC